MIWNTIVRRLTGRVVGQVAAKHTQAGNLLDARLGLALLRDGRVPVLTKLMALGLGIALTYVLEAVEAPLELLVGALVPGLGLAADFLVDGAEAVICPVLFASLLLPHLAPKPVAAAARAARRGAVIIEP